MANVRDALLYATTVVPVGEMLGGLLEPLRELLLLLLLLALVLAGIGQSGIG